jgi:polyisoprenoid-binding protein YceI
MKRVDMKFQPAGTGYPLLMDTNSETMKTPPNDGQGSNRRNLVLLLAGVVLLVIAAVGAYLFLFGDSPDEVTIDAATAQLEESGGDGEQGDLSEDTVDPDTDEAADDPDTDEAVELAAPGGVEGNWVVDTGIGEFGFEDSTGTFVGFRVDEELSTLGAVTAVGRTPDVTGTLTIEDNVVTNVSVEAQMGSIVTDDSRRDNRARGALDTDSFPTATFTLSEPVALPDEAQDGSVFSVEAVGELTIRGEANPATFALEAQLVDDVVVVVGSTSIEFTDYGITAPSAPIVVSVEDNGIVELQLFFSRG